MGSPCEVQLYAPREEDARGAAKAAETEVRRLEIAYSRYRDDSITARVNRSAGAGEGIDVDYETAALLDYAQTAWQQSGGLFDITSGVLRAVWNFRQKVVPSPAAIEGVLPRIGWDRVDWQRPRLRLPAGMELDFGGFVKEYAADCAARVCRESGIRHGLVDLGGDVALIGPHPDGSPWNVGVRHPRDPERALATVELAAGAIASSGDYERFFEIDGRRYCHVLNPRTGWPATGLSAVSVLAETCLVAGTATTIAMLKGREAGPAWLAELGLPYLCVDSTGAVRGTLGAVRS